MAQGGTRKAGWLNHRSVQSKMLLAFGLVLSVFVAGTMAALFAQEDASRARALSSATYATVVDLEKLARATTEQQLTLRGYVITRNHDFLDSHEAGREDCTQRLDVLKARLAGDPLQLTRLAQASTLLDNYWEVVADPVLEDMEHAETRAKAVAAVTSGEDGRYLDELRGLLQRMQATAQDQLGQRTQAVEQGALSTRWILLGVLVGGVLLGLATVLMATEQITRPLEKLSDLMTRLADNDLAIEVPEQDRRDEVGGLARGIALFKRMAQAGTAETWVKSGVAAVSAQLSRARTLEEFAGAALAELAPRLESPLARFLRTVEGGALETLASYGSQAWSAEQKYNKLECKFALGGQTLGSLEFARGGPLEVRHDRLLEEVLPILALSWDNLSHRLQLAQSERELKDANEALEEKSEAAHHQATHDPLTGVPNRLLFMDRLEQSLARANRNGTLLALCYVDIDGFKPVNDRHGHQAGDVLLCAIAGRMHETLRRSDTVARLGGDEFVMLMEEPENEDSAFAAVERLGRRLAEPYVLAAPALPSQLVVEVGASIGVAYFPSDARSEDALMQAADAAMYAAKQAGKNRVVRAATLAVRKTGAYSAG